jgi:hypothetical protein
MTAYDFEQAEWRAALRYNIGPCPPCPPGQHHMLLDGRGGGVCSACGEHIDREEL